MGDRGVLGDRAPTTGAAARNPNRGPNLLEVSNLNVKFRTPFGEVTAVRHLSFSVVAGETVGIVGESGSGKSVTGLALMGLLPVHSAKVSGQVLLSGDDLLLRKQSELEKVRGNQISMIFQEPMTALDPVFTIGQQIGETLRAHRDVSRKEAKERSIDLLDAVGIPLAKQRMGEYPHQLSGGMRQRVVIAIALACEPKLLIADEPTTALDVTIQAEAWPVTSCSRARWPATPPPATATGPPETPPRARTRASVTTSGSPSPWTATVPGPP